jgi:hypothetical protein
MPERAFLRQDNMLICFWKSFLKASSHYSGKRRLAPMGEEVLLHGMSYRHQRMIQNHSRPGIAHHGFYPLAFCGAVAMHRAFLAGGLSTTIMAPGQALLAKLQ